MKLMTSELGVVHERFGEDGLDAILTPGRSPRKMNQTEKYNADAQLESTLFDIFN